MRICRCETPVRWKGLRVGLPAFADAAFAARLSYATLSMGLRPRLSVVAAFAAVKEAGSRCVFTGVKRQCVGWPFAWVRRHLLTPHSRLDSPTRRFPWAYAHG